MGKEKRVRFWHHKENTSIDIVAFTKITVTVRRLNRTKNCRQDGRGESASLTVTWVTLGYLVLIPPASYREPHSYIICDLVVLHGNGLDRQFRLGADLQRWETVRRLGLE